MDIGQETGTVLWGRVTGYSCKRISAVQIRCGESKGGQAGQGRRLQFSFSGNVNQNQELWIEFLVCRRIIKVKVKLALEQAMKAKKGSRRSFTLSLTSVLDGGGWSTTRPTRYTLGNGPVPIVRPQGRSGRVRKISLPLGFDPRTVQAVASRCTD